MTQATFPADPDSPPDAATDPEAEEDGTRSAAETAEAEEAAAGAAGTAGAGTATDERVETTVEVRAVGKFRHDLDEERFEFTFRGDTLRAFVGAFLGEHPELAERLVGETRRDDADWTELRDTTGNRTQPYVRAMVNGTFNEFLDGADTELAPGDRVELVYPLTC